MPNETEVQQVPGDDNLPIASCTLDRTARSQQERRYRSLSASVIRIERSASTVAVTFDESLNEDLLEQALDVERECCSFFQLDFDRRRRRLAISVSEIDQTPGLDVLAAAFTQDHWRQR